MQLVVMRLYVCIAIFRFLQIGAQYERENEADFKDKQDFQVWDRNAGVGKERACLGCRALMERNLSKILPAILRDMTDWTAGTRIKVIY